MAKKGSSKKAGAKLGKKSPLKGSLAKAALKRPSKTVRSPKVHRSIPAVKVRKPLVSPAPLRSVPKTTLSKAELAAFRQMLMEKRRSLIGDMDGMESEALRTSRQENSGDLSLMPDHPANIATDNFEQEFTLGLLESERTLLREINEALERIDGGTYGICLGTGDVIGKPRLLARPWAKYCIEYARKLEKGLVRPPEEADEAPEEEPSDDEDEEVEEDIPDTED